MKRWFTDYNITVFTLVFMSVQFLAWEGWTISMPKVTFMCLTPFLLVMRAPFLSKAIWLSLLYWVVTVAIRFLSVSSPRMSTFYYALMFLSTFCFYYNMVHIRRVFVLEDFLKVVKLVIYAYAGCLVLQQACMLVGIRMFPLLNLMNMRYYSLFRLNTLAIEPSHAARLLTVYFYAFIKLLEFKNGIAPSVKELWREHRRVVIAFLYAMVAMGSGTAFVGLAILSLYFIKRQYAAYVVLFASVFYIAVPFIDYEPLNRAINVFNVAVKGDTELVTKTDHSAASRVNIIIDTITQLDLSESSTWLGRNDDNETNYMQGHAIAYAISEYGFISYICKLLLFFACCFSGALELLIFVLLLSFDVTNIAYGWAILMVFSTIKYFKSNYIPKK